MYNIYFIKLYFEITVCRYNINTYQGYSRSGGVDNKSKKKKHKIHQSKSRSIIYTHNTVYEQNNVKELFSNG